MPRREPRVPTQLCGVNDVTTGKRAAAGPERPAGLGSAQHGVSADGRQIARPVAIVRPPVGVAYWGRGGVLAVRYSVTLSFACV
jgi:hypothetical protein